MSLFSIYKTDKDLEQKGARIEKGTNDDGTVPAFYIAARYHSNIRYLQRMTEVSKKHKDEIINDTLTTEQNRKIDFETFIECVLTGWENVKDDNNEEIPYSKDNARHLMQELPRLYDELNEVSNKISNYRVAERKVNSKN